MTDKEVNVHYMLACTVYTQIWAPSKRNLKYMEFLETLPPRMPESEALKLWREHCDDTNQINSAT